MVTPISASAVMLRRWTSPNGVSRATSTSLRRSLRVTSAARMSRFSAYPWQMPASVSCCTARPPYLPSRTYRWQWLRRCCRCRACGRPAHARSFPFMPVSSRRTLSRLAGDEVDFPILFFPHGLKQRDAQDRPAGLRSVLRQDVFSWCYPLSEALVRPVIQGCVPERFRRRRPTRARDASLRLR